MVTHLGVSGDLFLKHDEAAWSWDHLLQFLPLSSKSLRALLFDKQASQKYWNKTPISQIL